MKQTRPAHSTVALRENQILEKYFPAAMENSTHVWTPEIRTYVDGYAVKDQEYVSYVSWDLITRFSERQVLLAFAVAIVAFLLLGAYLGRGAHGPIRSSEGHRP